MTRMDQDLLPPRDQTNERAPARAEKLRRVVVVFDHGYVNGGAAKVAIDSAVGLARRGVRVDYFCAVGPPDPMLTQAGVTVTCLDQPEFVADPNVGRAMLAGLWKPSAAKALADLLSTLEPAAAVVHIHGWTKALSSSVVAAALASRIPTLVTLHEYFSVCPNGGFYNYQKGAPCGRVAMSPACIATHCDSRTYAHKLWRVARQAVTSRAGVPGKLREVIYISDFSRAVLEPYYAKNTRWRKVTNGINVARAPRVPAENNKAFLFLGRLSPEKGAPLLAEAAAKVSALARFVGDGPQRREIEPSWPKAEFLGWLPPEKAIAEIERARALVFPSLWYEVAPLTIKEALARGVPIIVADGGAARDSVAPGENGLLFRSGDAADLAKQLVFLADDARVKAMSEAAYAQYWSRPSTPASHLDELVAAYEGVLTEPT